VPHEGFVGRPLDGTQVRVRREDGTLAAPGEVGDLEIAGPTIAASVLDDSGGAQPLAPEGWLRTADRGALDADGCLTVLGRADDVIVTGGENVAPEEVEGALLAHPAIADAGVAGVPDPEWGQAVCAWIVPRDGTAPSLEELRAACAGRLARHKLPRRLILTDALPRTASGKLRRRELAAALEATRA
jgi:acyl-CoA synthetase (AMP-forming)/AMP-acid ligase II